LAQSSNRSGRAVLFLALAACASTTACANLGQYVWVQEYRDSRPPAPPNSYVLGVGDTISVRVFGDEGMSAARVKVRSDGKVSLPLLNDVQAEGYTPNVLAEQLEARLKDFRNKPLVTVSIDEQRQLQIPILGEVARQGVSGLPADSGLLQALATAGGLTELAHKDRIFVFRNEQEPVRIRFSYNDLVRNIPPASTFRLRNGDLLVVE
jgi:polysaccharide export outer membrane protein